MTHPLRIGIKLSQDAPIESFRRIWSIADQAGFDHCWAFDHLATIGPVAPDRPVFEGWTLLAAMAIATTRPRLGLLVTGITYRNPALLAKLAVSVDHLSGGRLEFGVGAAWAANEHEMYGITGLDHRVGLLSEGLQVLKMLWTEERSNFDGRYFRLKDAIAIPTPKATPATVVSVPASLSNGNSVVPKIDIVLPTTSSTPSKSIVTVRSRAFSIEFMDVSIPPRWPGGLERPQHKL